MTPSPHSRRFDRVEILNRLKAVEAGEMTLYERELVEQVQTLERQLALANQDEYDAVQGEIGLQEQLEALRRVVQYYIAADERYQRRIDTQPLKDALSNPAERR